MTNPGINGTSFNLIFGKARRLGFTNGYNIFLMGLMSKVKRQYKLKRIKSRLRVSFIGYSYNVRYNVKYKN